MLSLISLTSTAAVHGEEYTLTPVPDWVKQVNWSEPAADNNNHSNGIAYLLVDNQWKLKDGQQAYFHRIVTKAINSTGVKDIAQIALDFDPQYEKLSLHELKIYRGGVSVDMLDHSQRSVIQREKELEYQIYDGSKTLNIILEDVRPGDIVDYSYSIDGANPVFSGHFSQELQMRWGVPVGTVNHRLLWSGPRKLNIAKINTDIKPVTQQVNGYTEYAWHEAKVDELVVDDDTPNWYEPYPIVYLSDFATWRDVVDWALPYYASGMEAPEVQQVIEEIKKDHVTREQQVIAALHFVQDDVRYLGIEMGVRSHKPNSPASVIKQRYGDCKDKSRLLVSLLKGMGMEASPALVNNSGGVVLKHALPTPAAFNHVIVQLQLDGKTYWLDPTRTHQGNSLEMIYQPDYDYALVLSERNTDLIYMTEHAGKVNTKVVEETIDIRGAKKNPATYTVITEHGRYFADTMRTQLAETSIKQLQQSFLNYTAHYFPSVVAAGDLEVNDDKGMNRVTVIEHYAIPDIWSKSDDGQYLVVNFEPFLIDDEIKDVTAPNRTMPYAVTHPVLLQHTTRVLMPPDSRIEDEFHQIEDKAFSLSQRVHYENDVLLIEYRYESHKDHVNAEDIKEYARNIRAAMNLAIYSIRMPNPEVSAVKGNNSNGDVNWLAVVVIAVAFVVIGFVVVKYVYLYDPPFERKVDVDNRLQGIGGWLVLSAIGIVGSPIKIGVDSMDLLLVFSESKWMYLADQFGSGFLVLILGEAVVNMALLMMSVALIVMFFTKRHTFPKFFIAFLLFSVVITAADLLAVHLASFPGVEVDHTDMSTLLRVVVTSIIWSLYYLKSERVKATFIRQRHT